MKKNTRAIGDAQEEVATQYLENLGFVIVERNYYASKFGEIDIIASRDGVLHFIEVKSSMKSFDPIYNVSPSKLRKLIKSAYYYLNNKQLDMTWCVDVLLISQDDVEIIENITL